MRLSLGRSRPILQIAIPPQVVAQPRPVNDAQTAVRKASVRRTRLGRHAALTPQVGALRPAERDLGRPAETGPSAPSATQEVRDEEKDRDCTVNGQELTSVFGAGTVGHAKASERELVGDHQLPDTCVMAGPEGKQDEEPGEKDKAEQAPGLDDPRGRISVGDRVDRAHGGHRGAKAHEQEKDSGEAVARLDGPAISEGRRSVG